MCIVRIDNCRRECIAFDRITLPDAWSFLTLPAAALTRAPLILNTTARLHLGSDFTPIRNPRMVDRILGNTLSMHESPTSQDAGLLQQNANHGSNKKNCIVVFLQVCSFAATELQENCKNVGKPPPDAGKLQSACSKTATLQENCNAVVFVRPLICVLLQ